MTLPDSVVSPRSLRQVQITQAATGQFWVAAPPDEDPAPFRPFPLPLIDGLQLTWLMGVGQMHYMRTGTCLAALLLLDVTTRKWKFCLPWQQCGTDAACWRLDRLDGLDIGKHDRLAGVFQVVTQVDVTDMRQSVPPLSGLHLLQQFAPDQTGLWVCIRLGDDSVALANPGQVFRDEATEALMTNAPRLQLV